LCDGVATDLVTIFELQTESNFKLRNRLRTWESGIYYITSIMPLVLVVTTLGWDCTKLQRQEGGGIAVRHWDTPS
jgi:hypothetical protein